VCRICSNLPTAVFKTISSPVQRWDFLLVYKGVGLAQYRVEASKSPPFFPSFMAYWGKPGPFRRGIQSGVIPIGILPPLWGQMSEDKIF